MTHVVVRYKGVNKQKVYCCNTNNETHSSVRSVPSCQLELLPILPTVSNHSITVSPSSAISTHCHSLKMALLIASGECQLIVRFFNGVFYVTVKQLHRMHGRLWPPSQKSMRKREGKLERDGVTAGWVT